MALPTMTAIFDAAARLVGWYDGAHVFDRDLAWVAYRSGGDLFAQPSGEWMGPLVEGSLLDRSGKPVAWLQGSVPAGRLGAPAPRPGGRPLPPKRPLMPRMPLPPRAPLPPAGGWSALEWPAYIVRPLAVPVPVAPVAAEAMDDAAAPDGPAARTAVDHGLKDDQAPPPETGTA